MKKLRLLILLFCLTIALPLVFVIYQTYSGLHQEEVGQMRFFGEELFDQFEYELARLIQQEEARSVDEYAYFMAGDTGGEQSSVISPLATQPTAPYLLGYLQNNPDGSFQTPLVADMGAVPVALRKRVGELREVNALFNSMKLDTLTKTPIPQKEESVKELQAPPKSKLAERYLTKRKKASKTDYLGSSRNRVEEISRQQVYNISQEQQKIAVQSSPAGRTSRSASSSLSESEVLADVQEEDKGLAEFYGSSGTSEDRADDILRRSVLGEQADRFQVEVAPFQSVKIDDARVFVFRRIYINNQMYRQGFVILVEPLMQYLADRYFTNQPIAAFSVLELTSSGSGERKAHYLTGSVSAGSAINIEQAFRKPFDFLSVSLKADRVPASPVRGPLNIAVILLALFMLAGLYVLYRNVQSIVKLSERRSQFVSTVTHELKTPLTNIRMYVEMLEQGVAMTPDKEQEYLGVLASETTRLSGLINNVLELSRLEKKNRPLTITQCDIKEVFSEVETIMQAKLNQEGFSLEHTASGVESFALDREVLVQVLMNLMENSIKFGRNMVTKKIRLEAEQRDGEVEIRVVDTGPGVAKAELKKIFDDFYRVDNSMTRATGGTGIGLALVKKFINGMGGTVSARNNADGGLTIVLKLPS